MTEPLTFLDIGDTIRLTDPWGFTLHPERRNWELAMAMGFTNIGTDYHRLAREAEAMTGGSFYESRFQPETIAYRVERWHVHTHPGTVFVKDIPEHVTALADALKGLTFHASFDTGVKLQVDRVYIRKGAGMSDFSSYSFLLTDAGNHEGYIGKPTKKGFHKHHRFWVKLADCRNIRGDVEYKAAPGAVDG